MKKHVSTKNRLLVLFFLSMIIIISVVVGFLYYGFAKEIQGQTIKTLLASAKNEAQSLCIFLDRTMQSGFSISHSVKDLLADKKKNDSLDDLLLNMLNRYPEYYGLWLKLDQSQFHGAYSVFLNKNGNLNPALTEYLYDISVLVPNIIKTPGIMVDQQKEYYYVISVPVKIDDRIAGSAGIILTEACINKILESIQTIENAYAFLLDQNGTWLSYPSNDSLKGQNIKNYSSEEYVNALMRSITSGQPFSDISKKDSILIPDGSNRKTLTTFTPILLPETLTYWSLGITVPLDIVLKPIRSMLKSAIIASFIAILILTLLIWLSLETVMNAIGKTSFRISLMAKGEGDLTQRIMIKKMDEFGRLQHNLNSFVESLQEMVKRIKYNNIKLLHTGNKLTDSAHESAGAASQIQANINNVDMQSKNQASSIMEVSSAVTEIAKNIESMNNMIEQQASSTIEASSNIEEMLGNISSIYRTMDSMADEFEKLVEASSFGKSKQTIVSEKIIEISRQSDKLKEANQVITNMASQTNLLAMNAAIEAAHAGAAGRGFAVVAGEIRKLSESSSIQSKEISQNITEIQLSIKSIVDSSTDSESSFHTVTEKISQTAKLVTEMRNALSEQNEGSRQILEALKSMNNVSSEVRLSSIEMTSGNESILNELKNLEQISGSVQSSITEMTIGSQQIATAAGNVLKLAEETKTIIYEAEKLVGRFKV